MQTKQNLLEKKIEKSLDASIKEGTFASASSHLVWDYVTPYAISLGATNKEIGLLSVLQSLGNALAQIPGARMVGIMSRKTLWYITYIMSRVLWIPIFLIAFIPMYQVFALMILVFIITFMNGMRNPAWSSLIGDLVPQDRRGEYFGRRNMITGVAGLISLTLSGAIIVLFGFGVLFMLSVAIGLFSVFFFRRMYEPPVKTEFHYKHSFSFSPRDWIFSIRMHSNFAWFTTYICIVSFSIAMAAPFYAVFMLKYLDIGYLWYAILITLNVLVAIACQPYWGRFSDRYGDRPILIITSVAICFIPLIWFFTTDISLLIFVHVFDGFMFGGWTLVIFNFLLSATPAEKRTSYIANHTFLAGMATVGGTLLASFLIGYFEVLLLGIATLTTIFFMSFAIRIASLTFLPRIHSTYVKQETEPLSRLAWKLTVTEPAKAIYHALGHVYDVKWFAERMKEIPYKIYNFFAYKIRLYNADKA